MRVRGTGPVPCNLAIVGPYPGHWEDRTGRPFCGKAGDELDRLLEANKLPPRERIYLTNLHKEYRGHDYVYTAEDVATAWPELQQELVKVRPKTIVTLGREVTRLFLGDVDITDVEGIPWIIESGQVVFPVVHIAAGMRNPELSPYVVRGFQELRQFMLGSVEPRILFDDPIKEPHYEEITDEKTLNAITRDWSCDTEVSLDTEGWPWLPWSLQFSTEPGQGYLIRKTATGVLHAFHRVCLRRGVRMVYHSALHDIAMTRAMGIPFELPFDDTMVMAYLLQLEPLGLKAGCLRSCNMQMMDYADVVGDVGNDLARDYLVWLLDAEVADYEEAQHEELARIQGSPLLDKAGRPKRDKAGNIRYRNVKKLPSLPKTPLHRAVSRVLQSKRPRQLWEDQVEDVQVAGYARLGPLPPATLDHVSPAIAIPYGCRDADGTGRLVPEYRRRIDQLGLRPTYELEIATYPLLDRMQAVGIKPDLEHFRGLSDLLSYEIGTLQTRLEEETGKVGFNANSGDQVAAYIFGTLDLEELKQTSSGRGSTNDKILEALEHEHPEHAVISTIREYRELYKLKNTFVDRLKDFVNRWPYDGRIHTTLRTTRVVTGRLAASDPNLLAMPKHGKFAKEFRRGWIPEEGHVLGSWDLSQIELRIAAHLSQDPVMLAIYRGETRNPDGSLIDLHAALSQRIFGVEPKLQDESKHRLPAKAINFGFWMGQTAMGLEAELRKNGLQVSEDDAQRWLDDAHSLYKGARPYMEARAEEARRNGFIRCMSGRIRYIGGIRSKDDRVREEAERFAFSTPIQEGAQTVMKTNETVLWNDIIVPLQRQGYWIEPLIQIHDDIVLELQEDIAALVRPMMVECMTKSYDRLSVPIKTSSSFGVNWADMKDLPSAS